MACGGFLCLSLAFSGVLWYTSSVVLQSVLIDRRVGDGKYRDVIDVCEALAAEDYGSAPNALLVMVRKSPLFQETLSRLREAKSAERARRTA